MTCLLMIQHPYTKKLILGGDRRISWGLDYNILPHPKVVKRNNILLGMSGAVSLAHYISNAMPIPKHKKSLSDTEYVSTVLYEEILKVLRMEGILEKDTLERHPEYSNTHIDTYLLIGYKGHAFYVCCTEKRFDFFEISLPYAVGSGANYALGAYAYASITDTHNSGNYSKDVEQCLKIAAQFNHGCDDNIDIVEEE